MDKEVLKVIITAIVGPTILLVLQYIFSNKRTKAKSDEEPRMIDHSFFTSSESLKSRVLYSFSIENKGKQAITQDVLVKEISIFQDNYYELCEKLDGDQILGDFNNEVINVFNKSISEFSSYYIESDNYNPSEKQCLKIFLEKFNRWNSSRIDSCTDCMNLILSSKFYTTDKQRLAAVLDMLLGQLFIGTLNDSEKTLNQLNGDLKGLTFKNIEL